MSEYTVIFSNKKDYKTGSTYSVTVTKNTKGGLISEITIAENQ